MWVSVFKWFEIDSLATAYELQTNRTRYSKVFNSKQNPTVQILDDVTYQIIGNKVELLTN